MEKNKNLYSYCFHFLDNNVDIKFDPFLLPNGMSEEDGFKVISYLKDSLIKGFNLSETSLNLVTLLDFILDYEEFMFSRASSKITKDLYIGNNMNSAWYINGITDDNIKEIYIKYKLNYENVFFDNKEYKKVI